MVGIEGGIGQKGKKDMTIEEKAEFIMHRLDDRVMMVPTYMERRYLRELRIALGEIEKKEAECKGEQE